MADIPSKTSDFYYVNDAAFCTKKTYYFLLLRMPELHQQLSSGHTVVKKNVLCNIFLHCLVFREPHQCSISRATR
jgi:hypothetical protein